MKRSKKLGRVSWAPGARLCQEKLFASEECPSKISENYVDSGSQCFGFEASHYGNRLKEKLFHIPLVKWRCPPRIVLDWHVAAGEGSEEAYAQKQRELGVLEAVYPRMSAIPPSPSVSLDVINSDNDDSHIPIVPTIPIEEVLVGQQINIARALNASIGAQSVALSQGSLISGNHNEHQFNPPAPLKASENEKPKSEIQADVAAAAAAAALTVIMKSKEEGSLIDTDLLIKLLNDPKMIEQLVNDYKASKNSQPDSIPGPKTISTSLPPLTLNPELVITNSASNPEMVTMKSTSNPEIVINNSISNPEVVFKNLGIERQPPVNTASAPALGSKTTAQVVPNPSKIPDVTKIKKMISEYGVVSTNLVQPCLPVEPLSPDPIPTSVTPPFSAVTAFPVKDLNYYKSLVKRHGEMQEEPNYNVGLHHGKPSNYMQDHKQAQIIGPTELKPKIKRPCMFFNSSRGCRKGLACPYLHEHQAHYRQRSVLDAPIAKKMKFSSEITGRS